MPIKLEDTKKDEPQGEQMEDAPKKEATETNTVADGQKPGGHLKTIEGLDGVSVPSEKAPADRAITEALTLRSIAHGVELKKTEGAAPADRAINEALTMRSIGTGVELKKTEVAGYEMTPEKLADLQAQAAAEKASALAAKTYGGGDAKEGMGSILKEIEVMGVISVPAGKAPADNIYLAQANALTALTSGKGLEGLKKTTTREVDSMTQVNLLGEIGAGKTVLKPVPATAEEAKA